MATIIVGGIVAILLGLAVYKIYKDRKSGKCCGSSCEGCSGGCHSSSAGQSHP